MRIDSIDWNLRGLGWHEFWARLAPRCGHRDCGHSQSAWRRLCRRPAGLELQGTWHCLTECLEPALLEAVRQSLSSASRRARPTHRVPLGLHLLSRQQLTIEQLRAALDAQRVAGSGRIGEWLRQLGFVTEEQVTAALARQWGCPVLRTNPPGRIRASEIPLLVLESFHMVPIDFVEATATLHIAFGEGVDYGVLYAIERMLRCHTKACLVTPSLLRASLLALADRQQPSSVVFDQVSDATEFTRIIRSYAAKVSASHLRLALCGQHVWVRLEHPRRPAVSLLLRALTDTPGGRDAASLPTPAFSF